MDTTVKKLAGDAHTRWTGLAISIAGQPGVDEIPRWESDPDLNADMNARLCEIVDDLVPTANDELLILLAMVIPETPAFVRSDSVGDALRQCVTAAVEAEIDKLRQQVCADALVALVRSTEP